MPFDDHWELFDISTTETDALNNFPLIESGRIDFDLEFKSRLMHNRNVGLYKIFRQTCWTCSDVLQVILSPDTRILLNVDMRSGRHNEIIDIYYLDSGRTNFSPVSRLSMPGVPEPHLYTPPELAFSADGSKFAIAMDRRVSVWDIRSKVPLWTFMEVPRPNNFLRPQRFLQFSSGNLGKEILVFVEVRLKFTFWYPYLSNRWSESLAWSWLSSCNHSCDRCDIVWDRRKAFLQVWELCCNCAFLRSRWGNSVCWTSWNNLWVGLAEKWAWSWMVVWGGVGCPAWQKYFLFSCL